MITKIKKTIFFVLLIIIILFLFGSIWHINQKMDFLIEFQKISQLPTGSICIDILGYPSYCLDGEKDFIWYKKFTNLQDEKKYIDKKIYLWQAPQFTYIIAVIDKQNDQVVFVTYYPM